MLHFMLSSDNNDFCDNSHMESCELPIFHVCCLKVGLDITVLYNLSYCLTNVNLRHQI